jgi:hypothetical protein
MPEFMLAAFIIGVGLSIAAAGTHLYQGISRQPAMLRYDGTTFIASIGHLAMSFVCGPYIMLQLGWSAERNGTVSLGSALLAAFVAFGWSFIIGLLFMGVWLATLG